MSDRGVTETGAGEDPERRVDEPYETEVARGRSARTPFLLIGGTALVVWSVATLAGAAVLVVWWLG
jgi:hypothetical protein